MTSLWMLVLMACAILMTSVQSRSLRHTNILHLLKQLRNLDGRHPQGSVKQGTGDVPDLTHGHPQGPANQGTGDVPDLTNVLAVLATGQPGTKSLEYDESRSRQSFLQRIQKNADDQTDLYINMCYFCDVRCMSDIQSANYPNTNAYFNALSSAMETDLNSMEGYTFHVNTHFVLAYNQVIQGHWYLNTSAENAIAMLESVNDNFWLAYDMWQTALAYGCDAGFHAITESDYIWGNDYCGQLDGVANMFQICNSRSFGTVRLELNLPRMATLCTHELGHLCGMYHDGGVDAEFAPYHNWFMSNPVMAPLYQNVIDNCQVGNEHCPSGPFNCIMSASVATQNSFSACSAAYFNMFLGLANQLPHLYEDGCLPVKRSGDLLH